ncbi:MAG: sigma-70 family RNA polymerase sigma factor [Pseudomonadota bacterium]
MTQTDRVQAWEIDERRWAQWMALAHQGDEAAYRRLLEALGEAIENYIRVRFGPIRNIEDCVQESLLAVHKARHTYDPQRPFRPWLFTLVRHRTIDVLRQAKNEAANVALDMAALETEDPATLHRRLDGVKILETLAPDHREAIALTQYGGYTAAEAASWLGISETALKARLRRGLNAIGKVLEAEGVPI